ncbi:hypothetical protein WJX82_000858 [Trebouxia sp. C0006]
MKIRGVQDPGHTVYVGNLPFAITQDAVDSVLSQAGQVRHFRLVTNRQTGRHRGFGFCEYYHKASACAAIKRINGQEFQGKRLKVAALVGSDGPGKHDERPERHQRPDKAQRPEEPYRPDHQASSSQASAKRARPSSSDTEHELPQARPRLMPPPPPCPPSQALARMPRHKQRQTEAVKVLNLFNTDEYTIHLAEHSPSNLLHIWLQQEILLLASAMQIEAVADACIQFFLQPDQLSAQQLVELYQTCYLTTPETQKQALQLLVNMPWTDEVYDALCEVFTELIQQPELCKELLLSEGCGNMCGMQVCDMLTACGLSPSDSLLPELLQRDRITKVQRATSRCTSLISSSSTRKEQIVRRFHMLDGCHTTFELTIPSRDSDQPCTLMLQDAKIEMQ